MLSMSNRWLIDGHSGKTTQSAANRFAAILFHTMKYDFTMLTWQIEFVILIDEIVVEFPAGLSRWSIGSSGASLWSQFVENRRD
jgi:hypothetical protein